MSQRAWLFHAILTSLVAFGAVSTDLYLAAIPGIVAEFQASAATGQLTLSIYMFGFAFGQLFVGPWSDYSGRRPVLLAGLALYVLGTLLCLFAWSMEALLAGRLVQGLGAAVGPVLARAIVSDLYDGRQAARVLSFMTSVMALMPGIAPVIGSWLLYFADWRSNFWALLLFSGVVWLAVIVKVHETNQYIGQHKPSVALLRQRFGRYLRHPLFVGYLAVTAAVFGGMFAYISSTSFIVIEVLGLPEYQFGYTFLFVVIGYVSGAFISGWVVNRLGIVVTMGWGVNLALLAALALWVLSWVGPVNLATVLLPVFVYFLAAGMTVANGQAGAFSLFRESAGGAASVFGFMQIVIAGLAGMVVGQLYDGTVLPAATVIAAMALMSAGFFWLLLYPRREPVVAEEPAR